jgi:UDP-N-acetylmuramoyl-L-alanyl-D-glutamate--2,6-diaminopimelate ligase
MKILDLINKLKELDFNFTLLNSSEQNPEISQLVFDSRKVDFQSLFFAIPGTVADGSKFVNEVVLKGVAAIFVDQDSDTKIYSQSLEQNKIPIFKVNQIRRAITASASLFYNTLNVESQIAGVTGTNGKTSVTWIISQLAALKNGNSFYFGTLGTVLFNGTENIQVEDDGRTSTDSVSVHRLLRCFYDQNIFNGAIEVTSHGIDQARSDYIDFSTAVFTNLTQDHLDYHGTMENYGAVKSRLFQEYLLNSKRGNKIAVINSDDEFGRNLAEKISTLNSIDLFDISSKNNSRVKILNHESFGVYDLISFSLDGQNYKYKSYLLGSFNVYNTLLGIIAAQNFGMSIKEACEIFETVKGVPGRLELVEKMQPRVFVDYAHTPDALEKVTNVTKNILLDEPLENRGKLITVFGCGGDRDKTKRPLMAKAVDLISDISIITSDNPRTEDPEEIINDMLKGVLEKKSKVIVEKDRLTAIKLALELASTNDIVLIAGKGHEDYQEINGVKHAFDDRVEARKILLKQQ